MAWTEAQQKVIDTRNKNILVSAAAGSGKTAVLVERIISMISEGDNPIDIDHLLVVTFTNAAAAQMRERIGKALDKKLMADPDNRHLQKQISLLQSSYITTIHSFCLNVIRNYFHRIDLDPSFKLADDAENTLMKSDVMAEVLERWYEEGREDFHEFIESYSRSKSDLPVEELVLQLYHFSMSNPWPKVWLSQIQKTFELNTPEEMEAADWMKELLTYIGFVLEDLTGKNEEAIAICNESDGPSAYLTALLSDQDLIQQLKTASTYQEYARLFPNLSYARLSSKREEGVSQEKKELVKALREQIKKGLKDLAGQFFYQQPEEMLQDLQSVGKVMKVLFELTEDFMDTFALKKEEKNLIDFNDLEHFALNILVENIEGEKVPTRAAVELSEHFEEILIDEYQDSNLVQETILQSISRERFDHPNRFMVGDVKQSIYKFRLAMPELFMEKYKTYSTKELLESGEANPYQRIDLDKNFRSRKVVLDSVNAIFEQIMTESVGGITYDEAASLKYGELFEELIDKKIIDINSNVKSSIVAIRNEETAASYESGINGQDEVISDIASENSSYRIATDIELMLVTEEDEEGDSQGQQEVKAGATTGDTNYGEGNVEEVLENSEDEILFTKKELEARAIARKIKELVDPDTGLMLFDKDTMSHRSATYRDIVILLRSMSGWSELFVNTLMQEGIPAYADTGTGYFQTVEIMTILNMLRIIDNPRQDIPFTGVLYSPMVGLTTTELAKIRIASRNCSMYQAACAYTGEDTNTQIDEALKGKLKSFLTLLEEFRSKVKYTPIHELMEEVLERTGYYYYVLAMPGGDRRRANVDMLVSQAVRFEKGSYSGLFHFIRYIEKLHKYDVDFGEAATSGEQDNTVRIMSIHKSKGLEFPVAFVAGLSKQFNTQDLRNSIVLHSDYGVGPEYIDTKMRTKVPTLLKKVIQKKVQVENLGEELRVLYVAMTRAKEKLILSGYLKSMDELKGKNFTFYELTSSKSYLEYVLPAMLNRMESLPLPDKFPVILKDGDLSISIYNKRELLQEELTKQIFLRKDEEELKKIISDEVYDTTIREEISIRFQYTYPYEKTSGLKVKMSVSELKKLGQFIDEEHSELLFPSLSYNITETIDSIDHKVTNQDDKTDQKLINQDNKTDHKLTDQNYSVDHKATAQDGNTENNAKDQDSSDYKDSRNSEVKLDDIAATAEKPGAALEKEATIPDFIRGTQKDITGTDRGTLYHKVLELLDLTKASTEEEVHKEIHRMVSQNKLNEADAKKLKLHYIVRFAQSEVAARMRKAQTLGKLYKEKQFVIGVKASEIMQEQNSDELVLIQGIIDAFFEEDGEIVLLDYKSDIIKDEKELIKRYEVQLSYYRKALEQILKKKVKEMILYSLYLGKEIRC